MNFFAKYIIEPKNFSAKSLIKDLLLIVAGCFLYAVSVSFFLEANQLTPGGITGVAIIISHYFPVLNTGTLVILLNLPLMFIGIIKLGFKFLWSTILATVLSSVFIDAIAKFGPLTDDPMLACLYGGFFMAFGLGLVFRAGATTGGLDIVVKLLRLKFKHVKTGVIYMFTDGCVILASALVFRNINVALLAAITIIVQTFVLDYVLYGLDSAKLLYIVSNDPDSIAERLLIELETGITYVDGAGAYSGQKKKVIMCAVKKPMLPKVRNIVSETDKDAFMIVTSANAIFGEGYKSHDSEDL